MQIDYQHHENHNDQWIVECVFDWMRNGYFVEIGALDGKAASACYALEQDLGWQGVVIEGNPAHYESIRANRPGSRVFNACVAESSGQDEDFLLAFRPPRSGLVRHLSVEKLVRKPELYFGPGYQGYSVVKVPTMSLTDVLQEAGAPDSMEYLAVDIEGAEMALFQGFDFSRYRFKAISIEDPEPTDLLLANGYWKVSNPYNPAQFEHYFIDAGADADLLRRVEPYRTA